MPGVYVALLEYERARYERRGEVTVIDGREIRVTWVEKDGHSKGCFVWSRDRLDRIEAAHATGAHVVVSLGQIEDALWRLDRERNSSAPRPRLQFERGLRYVRVSRDDRIVPHRI